MASGLTIEQTVTVGRNCTFSVARAWATEYRAPIRSAYHENRPAPAPEHVHHYGFREDLDPAALAAQQSRFPDLTAACWPTRAEKHQAWQRYLAENPAMSAETAAYCVTGHRAMVTALLELAASRN